MPHAFYGSVFIPSRSYAKPSPLFSAVVTPPSSLLFAAHSIRDAIAHATLLPDRCAATMRRRAVYADITSGRPRCSPDLAHLRAHAMLAEPLFLSEWQR